MQRKTMYLALAASLGLAAVLAYAAERGAFQFRTGAPIASTGAQAARQARSVAADFAGQDAAFARKPAPAGPTVGDVGDLDSFGRNVRWLGQKADFFGVATDCAAWAAEDPGARCQQVADPNAYTAYQFNDLVRFNLPANASQSLLCHWLMPNFQVYFVDNQATNVIVGQVSYSVTATLENPVLANPALVNPVTGAPFNGSLNVGSLAYEVFQSPIVPGYAATSTQRKTVACNTGLISKRALKETYGLTQSQADSFFASPTTVHLNVRGSTRNVDQMVFTLGARIVGD